MTFTRAPLEAESSVTELPLAFATQTWVPSEAMADGLLKPVARAGDDLHQGAGRGRELGDRVAARVRHPDVGAVASDGGRAVEPVARAGDDLHQAPLEAESSVTELPLFATQTCLPSEAMPRGLSNP